MMAAWKGENDMTRDYSQMWTDKWYDALACGEADRVATRLADALVARLKLHYEGPKRYNPQHLRQGSRAGRRHAAERQAISDSHKLASEIRKLGRPDTS